MKKRICAILLALSVLCSLGGCGGQKTPEPEGRTLPIDELDCPLKDKKLPGGESVYELKTADLGLGEGLITMVTRFGDELAVVYDGAKLAIVDPLKLEVKATLDLSAQIESFDQVLVDNGQIAAVCYELNKVVFYNEKLEPVEEVPVALGRNAIKLSKDLNQVVWDNDASSEFYVYDRQTKEKTTVCRELAEQYPYRSLCGYDSIRNELYFDIRDEDYNFVEMQAWSMTDGTVAHTMDYPVEELAIDEGYMYGKYLKCDETDILIRDMEQAADYIIAADGIYECGSKAVDMPSRLIATSDLYVSADGQNATTLKLYDFNGAVVYDTDYITPQRNQRVSMAAVNRDQGYCALVVGADETNHLLVWDLLTQESAPADGENHRYEIGAVNDEQLDERVYRRVDELEEKYGFSLHVGDDFANLNDSEYTRTPVWNEAVVMRGLNMLDRALDRFPAGLTQQVNERYEKGLQFYLMGELAAISSQENGSLEKAGGYSNTSEGTSAVALDITAGDYVTSVIYHEFAHALHKCINELGTIEMEKGETVLPDVLREDVWESYNPKDFHYPWEYAAYDSGLIDDSYTCQYGGNPDDWYFISSYAKVSVKEDVAKVMEAALMEQLSPTGFMEGKGIQKKLKYLSESLRSGFDTAGWPEQTQWELLLK